MEINEVTGVIKNQAGIDLEFGLPVQFVSFQFHKKISDKQNSSREKENSDTFVFLLMNT